MSNKPNPAPLRRGFYFARFCFALIFNIQAVLTAFFICYVYTLPTAQNATQSHTEQNSECRTNRTADKTAQPTAPATAPKLQKSGRQRVRKNAAGAQEQRRKPERLHHRSRSKPNKASEPPKPHRLRLRTVQQQTETAKYYYYNFLSYLRVFSLAKVESRTKVESRKTFSKFQN